MTLVPTLTPADRRVLEALPVFPGGRLATIARRAGSSDLDDVRLTLRGLEHFGLAESRGGWWRKTIGDGPAA